MKRFRLLSVKSLFSLALIVLVVAGCFASMPLVVADAPWLDGWNNRLSFYLQGGSPLNASEPVQVQLSVLNQTGTNTVNSTTFYLPNLTQGDFEDLRVTANDGLTLYLIWNQSTISGVNCTFWATVPSVNATYYLYCNNPSASNVWNKEDTFVDAIPNVVGAWKNEETNTTDPVLDYSGNGNNGVATNTTTVASQFTGKNARYFNGASAFVALPNSPVLQNFTSLTCLISSNVDNVTTTGMEPISWGYWAAPYGFIDQMTYTTGQRHSWYLKNTTGTVSFTDQTTITPNTWVQTGFSWNGTIWNNIKNGVLQNPKAFLGTLAGNINPTFGKRAGGANYYQGSLGYVILLSSSVTPEQLTNIYSFYPDVGLVAGEVLVRNYVYSVPVVSAFGVLEYYVEPTPTPSPVPDVTTEDAVGLAAVAMVFAVALPCAFLMMRRKKEDN